MKKGKMFFVVMLMLGMVACSKEDINSKVKTGGSGVQEGTSLEDMGSEQNDGSSTVLVVEDGKVVMHEKNGDTVLDTRTAIVELSDAGIAISGNGCVAEGACLEITEAGVYEISGMLSNGSICIDADKESDVYLILNGMEVHNENGAALFCKKAAEVTVVLEEDSVNALSDGEVYVFEDGKDEPDATLFSKQDLVITGGGTLKVTSVYGDAIKGKDSLFINGGIFEIKAVDDGIVGRDLLKVNGGVFDVQSESDAIKSSNDTDPGVGNIEINGGVFTLFGESDDIQAENKVIINGGVLTLSEGKDGIQAENGVEINGGVFQ